MSRTTDVVVLGAGVAGLSTALGLAATRGVLVLDAGAGSTPWAQGGIATAFGADDPQAHAADTMIAGAGACDADAVRVLVEEGPQRVAELIALGGRLDHTANGEFARTLEGGHHFARIVHAGGDATGAEVARALRAAAVAAGVEIIATSASGLLRASDGTVTGVLTIDGERIGARAVVLATGGLGYVYRASTNPAVVRGDGLALALRAGAALMDMEFVQFHPTALFTGAPGEIQEGQLPLVSEAVRGAGAVLVDAAGNRIMAGRHPLEDLAPRDIVAREIDAVMTRDGASHVFLDARSVGDFARRFPTVAAACAQIGVDPATQPIPVAPAEHFLCGGVRVDHRGATDVPGLYAVGEVAATGVHGANRLASNSLLEGMVFGRRLAAELTLQLPFDTASPTQEPQAVALGEDEDPQAVRAIMTRYAGIRREGNSLAAALDQLDELGEGPLATVARAVVASAAERAESRGCHWRSDFAQTLPNGGRHHVVVRLDENGRPEVEKTLKSA
ncbi:MAG TPA: L-aspartate oxidase [Jatrophihabitans sp.]|jgi:L-aspartate oxidase